ncbi:MAG: flavoprotein [Planctomycetota bacterium]
MERPPPFQASTILLGVTGGIAAYKAVDLASRWHQRGARVRVLMTPAATRFVTPLTFQAVTREPVASDIWQASEESGQRPEHIDAGEDADLLVVAPATADFLARAACGLADDILALTLLAHDGPVIMAPAMNDRMWAHPAVERNVAILRERGVTFVEPATGRLACGSFGQGRLADLDEIDDAVAAALRAGGR